jgi:hypothetical protein
MLKVEQQANTWLDIREKDHQADICIESSILAYLVAKYAAPPHRNVRDECQQDRMHLVIEQRGRVLFVVALVICILPVGGIVFVSWFLKLGA